MRLHFSPINALLVIIAFGWFLLFAYNGLWAQFSIDDLTNLHGYLCRSPASLMVDNLRYWSTSYRPLGGLFYLALYRWFGFDPLPFRVACFGLLALNLGLLWRFTLRLSGSREVAFLALILAGYHAWFVDLYYSTGTVYDLLCYSFYLGAFNLYLGVRGQGLVLAWRHLGILIALYVCALNAKEMAVTLPVMLAAYEVIYHWRALGESGQRWPWREGRGVLVTGLLTVPYVIGKLTAAGNLAENPAYQLTISPSRYLHTFHLYLNPLLYQDHVFRDANTIQLLVVMLGIALWRRSRPLLFAWCFLLVSLLPVAFMAHYAAFFLYLPMAGWSLYAAVLLVMARRLFANLLVRLGRLRAVRVQTVSVVTLPIVLALFLAPHHRQEGAKTLRSFEDFQPPSRQVAEQLIALRPSLPRGAHVLFTDHPFARHKYFLTFLTRLLYRDMSITVEQAPVGHDQLTGHGHYDAVFRFQKGRFIGLGAAITRRPQQYQIFQHGQDGRGAGGQRSLTSPAFRSTTRHPAGCRTSSQYRPAAPRSNARSDRPTTAMGEPRVLPCEPSGACRGRGGRWETS
jgi:hypothetical protein